ncbi:MAG TPA: sigma-70 family RNA polymerase sigma factor [Bryobacteraceae bacterium]|nr:sigma-70 family RNA polymerase sigma factor [Bryobacteraceae bacterium]
MATSILDLGLDRAAEIVAEGDDLRLVQALRGGTEEAYEELLARFQQPVYTLALRLLEDQSEAGDVVQEVFLKVFRNIGSFRAQSTLKTWIYRITVNEAHNARRWRFRHKRREVELDPAAEDGRSFEDVVADRAQSPFEAVFDRERRALLDVALERLNPIFREAVVLRDIMDLSYEEIAKTLNVSMGTVKSRILRGREALREQLAGDLERASALQLLPEDGRVSL